MSTMIDRQTWLEDRKGAIGASDVAAILGVSPWASAWDVWADKTRRTEPWSGNDATRMGHFFERSILDWATQQLGDLAIGERILHPTLPIASTLDARVLSTNRPVEAKTTGLVGPVYGDWGDEGTDQVPDYYLVQVHTQLLCTGADLAYLYSLIPGRGIVRYEIARSESFCEKLGNILDDWWTKHIINDEEPSHERASLEVVKRLKRVPEKVVSLDDSALSIVAQLDEAKATKKQADSQVEYLQAQLLASLGDGELGQLPDGREVTYFAQTRKSYTVEESTYRVMRIRKGAK